MPSFDPVQLDGRSLDLDSVDSVARQPRSAALSPEARSAVAESSLTVARLAESDSPIYGINTGYGIFATRRVSRADLADLSRNLVLSHAVGLGESFAPDVIRAAILIRVNTLALGLSGVRPAVVDALLTLLAREATPPIPSQGSLGSSGDLAPLAHLALALIDPSRVPDEPPAWLGSTPLAWRAVVERAGITPLALGPKEGLALINGATFAAAMLALACVDLRRVLRAAEAAAALSLEALRAASGAFDERLHAARPHPGQADVARRLRQLTAGSRLIDSGGQVQDAYSLRCTPQVLGPVWEILEFSSATARREINSATDNPLFFGDQAVSGGNFHGEPVGLACDFLKIAAAEVGALSERRTFRLLSAHTNAGLAPMLVRRPERAGLQSGLMMLQYTAASLVLENEAIAAPASVRSLPTSADQEDHNANATTAARDLTRLLRNLERIVAIELLAAAQALDLRLASDPQAAPGDGTRRVHAGVRRVAPVIEDDMPLASAVEALVGLLRTDDWLPTAGE